MFSHRASGSSGRSLGGLGVFSAFALVPLPPAGFKNPRLIFSCDTPAGSRGTRFFGGLVVSAFDTPLPPAAPAFKNPRLISSSSV